jgi:hypothetical protein
MKRIFSTVFSLALILSPAFAAPSVKADTTKSKASADAGRVRVPVNLAVLIQDDLVSRVGNELGRTRDFIEQLPAGSRVMVGYVTSGTLQVRQPFTEDLGQAAKSLRAVVGNSAGSPYNPYVEVREALKRFPADNRNANVLLLVSDGLDISRGTDFASVVNSVDLNSASREAQRRGVAVYTFYAPTNLTESSRTAASYGQSALNRLSEQTGGESFFQGFGYVSFDPYFNNLARAINDRFAGVR